MATNEQEKKLKDAMLGLEKQLGAGIFYDIDNKPRAIERWKLSSPALNFTFGGGLPKGRIIELYGRESHGKTLVSTIIAADVQKQGGKILYIDAEHGFDFDFAGVFGLNGTSENFILAHPDCAEDAMDIIDKIAQTGAIDLIVVDSIAALSPKAEKEGTNSDQQMGALARVLSKAFRKMVAALGSTGTTLICINQVREKIGGYSPYGPVITTPGGNALKFYSSIRAEIKKTEDMAGDTKDSPPVGLRTKIKIKKNKTASPGREAEMSIHFTEGVDFNSQYLDFALSRGIPMIENTGGSWYAINGERMNGKAKILEFFREERNAGLLEQLKLEVENTFVAQKIELADKPEQVKKRTKSKIPDSMVDAVLPSAEST